MFLIPELKLGIPAGLREKSGSVVTVKMQCDRVGCGPSIVLWGVGSLEDRTGVGKIMRPLGHLTSPFPVAPGLH